jgi:hypothetical protein
MSNPVIFYKPPDEGREEDQGTISQVGKEVKGRPFGSPLARGMEPRASTASDTTGLPVVSSAVNLVPLSLETHHYTHLSIFRR